jgi:hypothetical protein
MIAIIAATRTTARANAPVNNVHPGNILQLPRPTRGKPVDARLRAAGEGPKLLKILKMCGASDIRATQRSLTLTLSPRGARELEGGRARQRSAALVLKKGIRFLILSLLTLTTSCSQVHEKIFTLDCAIGRRPLPGELAPNTAMALDVSTSPIPLLFPAHRAIARCDNSGVITFDIETPVDTGISQLSTPISTAASHITYAP